VKLIQTSYSALDALRQCPHKHDLAYRQLWAAPTKSGSALAKGLLGHKAMEIHYRAIQAEATDQARIQAVATLLQEHAYQDDAELVAWIYDSYVEHYGVDPQWEILAVEEAGFQRLPTPSGRASRFLMRRRLDLLVKERRLIRPKILVVDHKFQQNLPTEKELDLDDQMGLYTWGLRRERIPVFGTVYNSCRTYRHKEERPLEERFARVRLYRTERELQTLAVEAFETLRSGYRYTSGNAPRSPDNERCRWRCPFTDPCLLGRKAGANHERSYLTGSGFHQQTEEEHWTNRGYVEWKEEALAAAE
jgi:hypothetical protein